MGSSLSLPLSLIFASLFRCSCLYWFLYTIIHALYKGFTLSLHYKLLHFIPLSLSLSHVFFFFVFSSNDGSFSVSTWADRYRESFSLKHLALPPWRRGYRGSRPLRIPRTKYHRSQREPRRGRNRGRSGKTRFGKEDEKCLGEHVLRRFDHSSHPFISG